ncbi:MAG TPA: hypothetical protein PKA20_15035, partial [Burkholderiaceae bacterium]|nr:hypothetical protein [Burkholderiaceae bacterium]
VPIGGAGADVLDGGPVGGTDAASYATATAGVTVDLRDLTGASNTGDALGDTFIEIDRIIGSDFDDVLYGYAHQGMVLFGGAGNDQLISGDQDDYLDGGAGADDLYGGGSFLDYAMYQSATTGVTVDLRNKVLGPEVGAVTNTGDAAGDRFQDIRGVIGSNFDDIIYGDSAENWIASLAGNDTITGNGGDDRFAFRLSTDDGNKTVTDFRAPGMGNDVVLITNVADTGTTGYTPADFAAAGYDVTVDTSSGTEAVLRMHLTADGADASRDTVVTFQGADAVAAFSAPLSSLVGDLGSGSLIQVMPIGL